MAKFYISSTYKDLLDERAAAARAVRRLGHQEIAMEDYVAGEKRPVDKCLADVRACDAYIGIVAWRYGPPLETHDKSVTHLEYEEAGKTGMPRFIFLLDEAAAWPRLKMDDDVTRVKQFRGQLLKQHVVSHFSNPDQLSALVGAAISQEFGPRGVAKTKPAFLPPSPLPQ